MRTLHRLFLVPLGLVVLQACAGSNVAARGIPPPPPPPPLSTPTTSGGTIPRPMLVPDPLRGPHAAYVAAWGGTNPAAVGAFFTEDAHGEIAGNTYHGRERIVAGWVTPILPIRSDLIVAETFTPGENHFTETGRMAGARYVSEWQRQPDGSWHIIAITVAGREPLP